MFPFAALLGSLVLTSIALCQNSTFTNPMLPGWHSDPTCIFVPEQNNTFFCATSSFLAFPGIPVYASRDLQNWRLVSNVLNRPSQFPGLNRVASASLGIYAPTLRYRDGTFYLIVVSVGTEPSQQRGLDGLLFTSTDPFVDASWTDPKHFETPDFDSDLFWDDDISAGNSPAYVAFAGIMQGLFDVSSANLTGLLTIFKGNGGFSPEGPHMYKKDGYYYILEAEGGTFLNHMAVMGRSRNASYAFESNPNNPIVSNKDTSEYFQCVGHADLFQDSAGNWWGVALSTRSGPEFINYPMGRETVLFPCSWGNGQWPICSPVRGQMSGPLPPTDRQIEGGGPFVGDPDVINFTPGSSIPKHFIYWRFPTNGSYEVSPAHHHPNTLRLTPSTANLTTPQPEAVVPSTFISRRQTHTYFNFSVDTSFDFSYEEAEVGVTAFLTQNQHIDLGIVLLPSSDVCSTTLVPSFRFRGISPAVNASVPTTKIEAVPESWRAHPIRLHIDAQNDTAYTFSATSSIGETQIWEAGIASTILLSGGDGPFTGTLLGAYATTNGGPVTGSAYIGRWRYKGLGQKIN